MTSMRRRYVALTSLRRHVPAGNLPSPLPPPPAISKPWLHQYFKPSYAYISVEYCWYRTWVSGDLLSCSYTCKKRDFILYMHNTYPRCGWMGICNFTSFSTVFQAYQDDGWVIMEGCMQWDPVTVWKGSRPRQGSNPEPPALYLMGLLGWLNIWRPFQ